MLRMVVIGKRVLILWFVWWYNIFETLFVGKIVRVVE